MNGQNKVVQPDGIRIFHYASPIGGITAISDGVALTGLWFDGQKHFPELPAGSPRTNLPVFEKTRRWLDLYFDGKIPYFTPEIAFHAGEFRMHVWKILLSIPRGKVMTYGEIARSIGPRMSAQAVGGAVGWNPVSLIVPCHRVIGSDGRLTGYAGGPERKKFLLRLEGIETDGDRVRMDGDIIFPACRRTESADISGIPRHGRGAR